MKTLILTTLAFCTAAFAADKKEALPDAKLSDFTIGEVVSGPAVNLANTGGKAVVIEAWGVNCGPCIASLPHIEKLAKRNKADTIVIGAECQNSSNEKIADIVKKNKLSYTITKGGVQGPVKFSGIPHAFVFDTTGKLIFHGTPSNPDFEKAVRKAGRPSTASTSGTLSK
jgi:thiol-disulfide isomerase/thioredoxin